MDFLCKVKCERTVSDKKKAKWLTVGIVSIIIAMIIELFFAPYASAALLIPLIYLFSIRAKMSSKAYYKDTLVSVNFFDDQATITVSNNRYYKRLLCSTRYYIGKKRNIEIRRENDQFTMSGVFDMELIDENGKLLKAETGKSIISLIIDEQDASILQKRIESLLS